MTEARLRFRRAFVVAAWWIALAAPFDRASADEQGYRTCMDSSASTVTSIDCQKTEARSLEADLNKTYQAVMAALPADQQGKLKTAERLWIEFRKADCDVFYGQETGTYASVQAGECVIQHARQRMAQLRLLVTP